MRSAVVFALVSSILGDVALVANMCYRSRARVVGRAASVFANLIQGVRRKFAMPSSDDGGEDFEFDEQVAELFVQRQVRYTQVVNIGAIGCWVFRQPTFLAELSRGESTLQDVGLLSMIVLFMLGVTGAIFPRVFHARTLIFWHFLYMTPLCISCSPLGIHEDEVGYSMIVRRPIYHVGAVVIALGYQKLSAVAFTNACFAACNIWTYSASPTAIAGSVGVDDVAVSEAVIFGGKLFFFAGLRSLLLENATQEASARAGQCERSAVTSLLAMVCDTVVEVDGNMRMRSHVASLANMLMHGAGRSLKSVPLTQLLEPGPDAESFERNIETNSRGQDGSPIVGMFGGYMRDAMHNRIHVIFYHVPYRTFGGKLRHLIGLCEDSDSKGNQQSQVAEVLADRTRRAARPPPTQRLRLPPALLSEHIASMLSARNSPAQHAGQEEARSLQTSSSSRPSTTPGEETITADVVTDDRLTIRYATRQLRSTFGLPDEGACFGELLSPDDLLALRTWLREREALVRRGSASTPHLEKYGRLQIRYAGTTIAEPTPRKAQVCFPAPSDASAYCVSINLGRHRPAAMPSQAVGLRGTAAERATPQELSTSARARSGSARESL